VSEDPPDTWQQADIGLGRQGAGPGVHAQSFFEVFTNGLPTDLQDQWFFQRKPPDIRLRVRCISPAIDAEVRAVIGGAIEPLLHAGVVRTFGWGHYVPETARFGGSAAIAAAHRHFCRDTTLWREAVPSHADERTRARLSQQLVTEIGTASAGTIGASSVWRRLLQLLDASLPPLDGRHEQPSTSRHPLLPPSPFVTKAHLVVAQSAADVALVVRQVGPDIDATNLVALLVHFDCNRWGVDGPRQRAIALDDQV